MNQCHASYRAIIRVRHIRFLDTALEESRWSHLVHEQNRCRSATSIYCIRYSRVFVVAWDEPVSPVVTPSVTIFSCTLVLVCVCAQCLVARVVGHFMNFVQFTFKYDEFDQSTTQPSTTNNMQVPRTTGNANMIAPRASKCRKGIIESSDRWRLYGNRVRVGVKTDSPGYVGISQDLGCHQLHVPYNEHCTHASRLNRKSFSIIQPYHRTPVESWKYVGNPHHDTQIPPQCQPSKSTP